MIGYETEEQQVQAIKKFWKDNGIIIAVGVIVGLALLWGWRYYNESRLSAQELASSSFQSGIETLVDSEDPQELKTFLEQQADTSYASLAALVIAQQAVDKDDYQQAAEALSKAIKGEDVVSDVARLRLADIQLQMEQSDQALASLDQVVSSAFEGQVAELRGDALMAQGNFDAAKQAYDLAIDKAPNNQNAKLKRDNIAYVKSKAVNSNVE